MLHTRFTSASSTKPQLPVWKVLFDRQMALLHRRAAPAFGAGVAALGLSRGAPPDLAALERQLRQHTGWTLHPEVTPLTCDDYFAALSARQLPVVTELREAADFDTKNAPDLFADVFGRLPMLLEPVYAEFLTEIGKFLGQLRPAQRPALLSFYHATADFGVLEAAETPVGEGRRVFGARLLSSARHLHAALDDSAPAPVRDWNHLHEELDAQRTTILHSVLPHTEPSSLLLAA
jgi:phenylalanine-4-hydroxylase